MHFKTPLLEEHMRAWVLTLEASVDGISSPA
jgi:hypothetical protein